MNKQSIQYQSRSNLSDVLHGIYFTYSFSDFHLTSLSSSGFVLLGLSETTPLRKIKILNFIHPDDLNQIKIITTDNLENNDWKCCSVRIINPSSKWEKLFVKFYLHEEAGKLSINGVAHIIPGELMNSCLLLAEK